uniref:IR3 protein n=1 Tax=Equid alphaherpesvirus 1 TaxID=10326 RepID=Q05535_9ALPH|nr:IR3 [Equid alphaherpesvirus 1]
MMGGGRVAALAYGARSRALHLHALFASPPLQPIRTRVSFLICVCLLPGKRVAPTGCRIAPLICIKVNAPGRHDTSMHISSACVSSPGSASRQRGS